MDVGLLLFVFLAIPFCVGAILGVLWRGRLASLVLCAGVLVLACAVGWAAWKLQTDPYRHMYDFRTFAGVADFASKACFHFGWVFWVCLAGGLPGAFGGYFLKVWLRFLKVWLRSRNVPPVLPANA